MVAEHMDITRINALYETEEVQQNFLGKGILKFVLRMLRLKSQMEEGHAVEELQDVKCNEASNGDEVRQGVVSAVTMGGDFGEDKPVKQKP